MEKESSETHIVSLESHCGCKSRRAREMLLSSNSVGVSERMIGLWRQTDSNGQGLLHREDVNKSKRRGGRGAEERCLSVVLICAFILFNK